MTHLRLLRRPGRRSPQGQLDRLRADVEALRRETGSELAAAYAHLDTALRRIDALAADNRDLRDRLDAVERERDGLRQRNIILADELTVTTVLLEAADERIVLLQQQAERVADAEKRAAAAEAELARLGAITVPPMVRNTDAPDDQATVPHGVRTVNGPVAVMPLAEAARRGHVPTAQPGAA